MKKLLWITLLLTLVLTVVACVNSPDAPQSGTAEGMTTDLSADTSTEAPTDASTEDSTEGVTEAPTEAPVDPKVQNAPLISSEDFMNPANEFRALNIEHGYPGGSIADRVQQLKDLGFGGVATNDPFTPNYFYNNDFELLCIHKFPFFIHLTGRNRKPNHKPSTFCL